jgi:hypothetical protein
MWLGIDTGGTFTDFVLFDGRTLRVHKVLSTPHAPEEAILQGVAEMGVSPEGLQVVHGSTVATNAVLERKGVRTAYITNHGLGDVRHGWPISGPRPSPSICCFPFSMMKTNAPLPPGCRRGCLSRVPRMYCRSTGNTSEV